MIAGEDEEEEEEEDAEHPEASLDVATQNNHLFGRGVDGELTTKREAVGEPTADTADSSTVSSPFFHPLGSLGRTPQELSRTAQRLLELQQAAEKSLMSGIQSCTAQTRDLLHATAQSISASKGSLHESSFCVAEAQQHLEDLAHGMRHLRSGSGMEKFWVDS